MNDSSIKGVSIRAILAAIIVLCFCGLAVWTKDAVGLKELALIAVSFYFGQKSQGGSNEKSVPDALVAGPAPGSTGGQG